MDTQKTLRQAIRKGQRLLPEDKGKALLSSYGINVPKGKRVRDLAEAEKAASALGYPLVLKALIPEVLHKSDRGAVRLGIDNQTRLRRVARELWKGFPDTPLLVEEQARPGVELIAGLANDPHFGPCLMIGLGGVFIEVFQDVDFLVLPAGRNDLLRVLKGLKGFKLLAGFRGKPAYDLEKIVDGLMGLSRFGMEAIGSFETVDINPLLINEEGATALDVKVVLKPEIAEPSPVETVPVKSSLEKFFTPRSVVVVGASGTPGKPGHEVIRNILANEYPGKLHLVNPRGGDLLGQPVSPSISALPDGIDLAIIILPAKETPPALREVASRGIRHAVLAAGGFAEVDEDGAQIQKELIDIIREKGLRVIGPNTSGHTSTPHRFTSTFFPLGKIRRGPVSYIAQTGNFATHTMKYILTGEHFGVSRVIGFGNKVDVEESEALAYLAGDPETRAILIYLESIKYPRRFLEVAKKATRVKPVVLLKGGITEAGKHAAVAHTAAMAAEDRIVDGMLRQAGIVRIWDYTHLILAGKAFSMIPMPKGNRVSFMAPSGAMLVVLADLCARIGLEVPDLEPASRQKLQDMSPSYIRMRNPVDIWPAAYLHGVEAAYRDAMETVLRDPNIDAVVPIFMLTRNGGVTSFDFIIDLARKYPEKPILVTFSGDKQCMEECKASIEPRGVPAFFEVEQPFEVLSILYRCAQSMNRPR